jgi:NUMOD4 motif-containing protein
MEEQWKSIPTFPDYKVSNLGAVRNIRFDRYMTIIRNRDGLCVVGLSKKGRQHKRSLPLLVAHAFVKRERPDFDQPIHLDGDQLNNRADNLAWRPHWFAVKHAAQFRRPPRMNTEQVIDLNTGRVYINAWQACIENGLLHKELVYAMLNRAPVFPSYHQFRFYSGEF